MKITTYQQLDKLVAKELGWVYEDDSEDCYYPVQPTVGWAPPCKSKWREIDSLWDDIPCHYSTNLEHNQEVINYIHSLDLELTIESNISKCIVEIHKVDKNDSEELVGWDSICGVNYTDIDSTINSVPLAICLAFLKYKGIEVELDLNDLV